MFFFFETAKTSSSSPPSPIPTTPVKPRHWVYQVALTAMVGSAWLVVAAILFGLLDPHIGLGTRIVLFPGNKVPLITPQLINDIEALNQHRKTFEAISAITNFGPKMKEMVDTTIPSRQANRTIPVRLYYPQTASTTQPGELLPMLMWIHGGGWTLGSIQSDDSIARRVAHATGALVVSVEYRLAPEHKWPAQLEDVVDAIEYMQGHGAAYGGDTSRFGVAGESAGGQLTLTSVLSLSVESRGQLCGIMPVAPAVIPHRHHCSTPSCETYGDGYLLTKDDILIFWNSYVGEADFDHHLLHPLSAKVEHLEGFPPMLMTIAGRDPLRDEAEAFHAKLTEAGVDTSMAVFERTVHGFFGRGIMTHGMESVHTLAEWYQDKCIRSNTNSNSTMSRGRMYDEALYLL